MHFIIPKNYDFKAKLFGIIDYSTALLNGVWAGILYVFVKFLFSALSTKIYCFAGLFLPFFLFTIFGTNNENIISVSVYVIKFYQKQKIFLYQKNNFF